MPHLQCGIEFTSLVTEYSKSLVLTFIRPSYSGFNPYLAELPFCVMTIYGGFMSDKAFHRGAQKQFFARAGNSHLLVFCGPVRIPFVQINV